MIAPLHLASHLERYVRGFLKSHRRLEYTYN